jgi:methylated-DNA-[protein]-cysteine S-methyltransferase
MDRKVVYTYDLIPWTFGDVGLIRRTGEGRLLICRILLPHEGYLVTESIRKLFPGAVLRAGKQDKLCLRIRGFLSGKAAGFALEDLDIEIVKGFARRVLQACGKTPRGRVTTYGSLAASLGVPGGARAVGNALAGNPFPLMIPCHRVVRSDGSLGGFGGGLSMKRPLLAMEGICFDETGRVLPKHIL